MVKYDTHNSAEVLTFNGINGATGAYLLPQVSPGELFTAARGQILDREHLSDLRLRVRQAAGPLRALRRAWTTLLNVFRKHPKRSRVASPPPRLPHILLTFGQGFGQQS